MGFFDKLKQAKNWVTGGGVKVYIDAPTSPLKRGETVNIVVKADVEDADVNVRQVYFKIRATETVTVRANRNTSTSTTRTSNSGGTAAAALQGASSNANQNTQDARATENTFNHDLVLEGEVELNANGHYEWTASFEIPTNTNPTYRGVNCTHEWQVYAGLDTRGNDPDSGWQRIEVQ